MVKYKILNDPVHGFITIPANIIQDLIEHPYFQRLRRITQMGMAHYVYPGALHSRFHHALGAMHLMQKAIEVLRKKGNDITQEEEDAVIIGILLHDIGHGPFSHALEHVLISDVDHEVFSELLMHKLNTELDGKLSLALDIFNGNYPKIFLHQLISSQLDTDRLDYLARDSFFTGVYEGRISTERIISMLSVADNQLVVEQKGLYSIEKYLISRRLMYWQVYLHKTAVAAEELLISIVQRAKELVTKGDDLPASDALLYFLQHKITEEDLRGDHSLLEKYCSLDDIDIMAAIKMWTGHSDRTLAMLSRSFLSRKLYRIELQNEPFAESYVNVKQDKVASALDVPTDELKYFVRTGKVKHLAYDEDDGGIKILTKKEQVIDFIDLSDVYNSNDIGSIIEKYYLCYPKDFTEIR